jgi:hypothetical protein
VAAQKRRRKTLGLAQFPKRLKRPDLERRLPLRPQNRFHDLTGRKLPRCTVVGLAGFIGQHAAWLCRCHCGELFVSRANSLEHRPIGCGCGGNGKRQQHGGSKLRAYPSWRSMVSLHRDFVCKRWRSFPNFYADLGERPKGDYVLSRRNRRKPYGPQNAAWMTRRESMRGKGAKLYAHNGRSLPLKAWAKRIGVTYERLRQRIVKCRQHGLAISHSLITPRKRKSRHTSSKSGRPKIRSSRSRR